MLVRHLNDCQEFIAGDHTRLRELLHPDKQEVAINYSLAHAVLAPGETSTAHRLKSTEVYYILSGRGLMNINDKSRETEPGDAIYIPPEALQSIKNIGSEPLTFICIVDPAWQPEDEIVMEHSSAGTTNPEHKTGK